MDETPQRITIHLPDDFHHHCRDGSKTSAVLKHAAQRFGRCLFMPNLKPPVVNTEMALQYRQHILDSLPPNSTLQPLMTLYLTDKTSPEEVRKAHATGHIVACKYYPAGATTNSDAGVSNVENTYPALEAMADVGMVLCIHSEVTDADIFEREPIFIEQIMKPLVAKFPTLKIVMEHISTEEAVHYVQNEAPDTVRASITCHHLLFNRNHMLVGGIRPHLYCLPILKAEQHRLALLKAATSGSPKFFLGTDSAPHPTTDKESACGCAGIYTAHAAVELYAEAFDSVGALDALNDFASTYGAQHYGCLPPEGQRRTIILEKVAWKVPRTYEFGDATTVTPLRAGEEVAWRIVET
ncbi:dihydroorotase [Fragilaria crotonensis]|nr:dihydroorotase [Fragilaria crotonensis]